jgi:hypothetical protein
LAKAYNVIVAGHKKCCLGPQNDPGSLGPKKRASVEINYQLRVSHNLEPSYVQGIFQEQQSPQCCKLFLGVGAMTRAISYLVEMKMLRNGERPQSHTLEDALGSLHQRSPKVISDSNMGIIG